MLATQVGGRPGALRHLIAVLLRYPTNRPSSTTSSAPSSAPTPTPSPNNSAPSTPSPPPLPPRRQQAPPAATPSGQRHRRKGPPQPGPPDPPWPPTAAERALANVRRKTFATPQGLAASVIMTGKVDNPDLFYGAPAAAQSAQPPRIRLGVPMLPSLLTDHTGLGPDVVAPWRRGGVFQQVPAGALRALRRSTNFGLRFRYTRSHALHPYQARYLEGSPGVEEMPRQLAATRASTPDGGGGGNNEPGFPHCFAEVMRRYMAYKNRDEPLWVQVLAAPPSAADLAAGMRFSPFVRGTARNKLRHAVRTALALRGYGPTGLRLADAELRAGARRAKHRQMYGTLRVDGALRPALETPYDDLVAYLAQVVDIVEGLLGGLERPGEGEGAGGGDRRPPDRRPAKKKPADRRPTDQKPSMPRADKSDRRQRPQEPR